MPIEWAVSSSVVNEASEGKAPEASQATVRIGNKTVRIFGPNGTPPKKEGSKYIITVPTPDYILRQREEAGEWGPPSDPRNPTWPPPGTYGGLCLNDPRTEGAPGPLRPAKKLRKLDYDSEPPSPRTAAIWNYVAQTLWAPGASAGDASSSTPSSQASVEL